MSRSRRFTFTLNNPCLCVDYFKKLDENVTVNRFVFGFEKGEQDTPHLQGYLETKNPCRLTGVNTVLTAHWETAKSDSTANYKYCTKDGNFQEKGDWSKEQKGKKRAVDISKEVIKGLLNKKTRQEVKNSHHYIMRKKAYDERIIEINNLRVLKEMHEKYKDSKIKLWQKNILEQLFVQDTRKIMWVVDETGNSGKSYLARLLSFVYGYDLFDGVTSSAHVAYLISESPNGFVFDVTRQDASHFSYNTLESVKNGFVMSGKYAGIKRVFHPVPVIVFANFEPDTSSRTLSEDRWCIHRLNGVQGQTPSHSLPPSRYLPEEVPLREEEGLREEERLEQLP